jgi:hypothetical protein
MEIEHVHAELDRFFGGSRYGVGNVVKFQIQKDPASLALDHFNRFPAIGRMELQTHFEETRPPFQKVDKLPGLFQGGNVQGEDHSLGCG